MGSRPQAVHWDHEPGEGEGRKIMGRKISASIFLPKIFLPNPREATDEPSSHKLFRLCLDLI